MRKEVLSVKEIKNKYKDEWVLLFDCEFDEHGKVKSGKVILHSPNRDDIYRKIVNYKGYKGTSAIRYLGEIPKDLTVLLWVK